MAMFALYPFLSIKSLCTWVAAQYPCSLSLGFQQAYYSTWHPCTRNVFALLSRELLEKISGLLF
jgi:hypothetical protein